jgi:hypothetical protein
MDGLEVVMGWQDVVLVISPCFLNSCKPPAPASVDVSM